MFFDAVGTLLFPAPGAAAVYVESAARHGAACRPDLVRGRMIAAYTAEEEFDRARGWMTSEAREIERWRRIVAASLPELSDPDACFHDLYEHFARPDAWAVNPDAPVVFGGLAARGLVLGVASNYDSRLHRVLAGKPELGPVEDRLFISSEVGYRKPSPQFFRAVTRTLGDINPADVVYVGDDHENDYRGAAGAGLTAVLYDDRDRSPDAVRVRRLLDLLG